MLSKIKLRPVITEKALLLQEVNKYVFWVSPRTTKSQIRRAVQEAFKVEPLAIRTVLVKGKRRKNWKNYSYYFKPERKKAIVQLRKGQSIDLMIPSKK